MKSKGGFKRQQPRRTDRTDRPGRPASNNGGHGGSSALRAAPGGGGSAHAHSRPSRGGPAARQGGGRGRGPVTCPMCGAVVPDLGAHVRSRHDDPLSHPRD